MNRFSTRCWWLKDWRRHSIVNFEISPVTSPHDPESPWAAWVGPVRIPRVVGVRSLLVLPRYVTPVVPDLRLHLGLHLQVRVVLRHGPGVRAALCLTLLDVVGISWIHKLVALPPVLQETVQWHRVPFGKEQGGLGQVLTHGVHLSGALQVEQDAGPDGVVHVPVVFQELVVEQTVVPQTDRLKWGRMREEAST